MTDASNAASGDAAAQAAAAAAASGQGANGQGAASPADAAAQAAAAAAAGATGAAGSQQAGEQHQQGGPAAVDTTGWPAEAIAAHEKNQTEIAKLRRENGDQRINAKAKAAEEGSRKALVDVAKGLGLEIPGLTDVDEGPGDPAKLAAEIQSEKTAAAEAIRDAAVIKAAWAEGVDPGQLDYLSFLLGKSPEFRALDHTAADFSDKLSALVTAQIATNATLRATGSPQASGVEHLGGANGNDTITPEAFASMSLTERSKLYTDDPATYKRLSDAQYA